MPINFYLHNMKNILLPLIGLLIMCFGLISFVVFKQRELGVFLITISIILQVINFVLIVKNRKIKSK